MLLILFTLFNFIFIFFFISFRLVSILLCRKLCYYYGVYQNISVCLTGFYNDKLWKKKNKKKEKRDK